MENIDYQAALTFGFVLGLLWLIIMGTLGYIEMRRKRDDELARFRRQIEAMRRLEEQERDGY